ncbi:MAG: cytochrome c oxidase subunit 3 [Actinomycetota bacterium]|nr:cytochrome c oxidase subunit 3 [Actinomycetota bacterium]
MTQTVVPVVPVPRDRGYPTAWWGMVVLITTEAMIFLALLSAYFFIRASSATWPLGDIQPPELPRAVIFTVVLLGSSIPIFWMESALVRGRMRQVELGLLISFVMGAAFLANTAYDFVNMGFGWRDNAYASLFYVILGLHALHVFAGLLMNGVVQAKTLTGRITVEHHVTPEVFALYWHFVDGVWIFVFTSLIVSPHFGR